MKLDLYTGSIYDDYGNYSGTISEEKLILIVEIISHKYTDKNDLIKGRAYDEN